MQQMTKAGHILNVLQMLNITTMIWTSRHAVVETPQYWNYDVSVNGGDAISNWTKSNLSQIKLKYDQMKSILRMYGTGPGWNLQPLDLQSDMHL